MSEIKLILSYHKKDILFKDDVLTPIHAGRALALNRKVSSPDIDWLLKNMTGDNTGDNISEKNSSYNEMTALYWAWKNYDTLGSPKYIGFMHYRRHFYFSEKEQNQVFEWEDVGANYLKEIHYSPENLERILSNCDFICPKPQWRVSLYEHYKRNHRIEDLDLAIAILKEKYPQMEKYADIYLNGSKAYFCNMFIMKKSIFFQYAEFVFDILFEFEKRIDITNKRLFISEWLTGIFITYLLEKDYKCKFLPSVVAEGTHKIPIVLAADENYAMPLSVTMTSILANAKKNTFYEFLIITPEEFSNVPQKKIMQLAEMYPKCTIRFVPVKGYFENVKIKTEHLSKVAFYRLLSANLFPEYSKVLYLDVDLIAEEDLSILFRLSVDDYFIAGVKAAGYYYPEDWAKKHSIEIGVPIDQYINSGVLLMDLNKFRKENLTDRLIELSENDYSSEDQDVLNIACYNQIKHLHMKYNVMTKYLEEGSFEQQNMHRVFPKDIITESMRQPVIVHYANKIKPWMDISAIWAERWWKYAVISPYAYELIMEREKGSNSVQLELELKRVKTELSHIRNSRSFKVGRVITFFPRLIRRFCLCCRDHGLVYSIKYGAKKVFFR